MAIDNAAFIADMNPEVPAITDPRSEGADQIAAVKSAVQATFPNADDVVNATAARMNEFFDNPYQRFLGEITMYDSSDNIPEGWALCDGGTYNGYVVPDLRGKFIMGYDERELSAVLEGGGTNTDTFAKYLHSEEMELSTSQIPPHVHNIPNGRSKRGRSNGGDYDTAATGDVGYDMARPTRKHTGSNETTATPHGHALTDVNEGTFDNRPEYIIVAFICYVGKEAAL